jgi:hypothetical protein
MEATITKESLKINDEISLSVKKYIELTDQIKQLADKQKELKSKKEEHETLIKTFMEENKILTFNVGNKINFTLVSQKKNTKKVNKDSIKSSLEENQVSNYVIDNVIERLYKEEPELMEQVTKIKVSKKI